MEDGLHVLPESHASHSRCYFMFPYKRVPAVTCAKLSAIPVRALASTWCTSEIIQEHSCECTVLQVPSLFLSLSLSMP